MRRCRECGRPESEVEFKPNANICKTCDSTYMKDYRRRNRVKIRDQVQAWKDSNRERYQERNRQHHATPEGKAKHVARHEKTPRVWMSHLLGSIKSRCKKPGKHDAKEGPKRVYQIDLDFLVEMYADQEGLCALSGLPMIHQFNDLCSISVDRIDSEKGYVPGNVQLVCKWVNLAKQRHSNKEFEKLLDSYYQHRRMDAGLDEVGFEVKSMI